MPERSFRNPDQTLFVAFRAKAGEATVFTEANVKEMYALEEIVLKHKGWAKYCVLDHRGAEPACAPPASLHEMLGGAETQADIDARLAAIAADPALLFRWGFNLDKDFGKGGSINARVAQSGFSLGLPLAGYKSPKEDMANQQKAGDAFLVALGKEMQGRYGMKAPWMMRSSYEDSAVLSGSGMEGTNPETPFAPAARRTDRRRRPGPRSVLLGAPGADRRVEDDPVQGHLVGLLLPHQRWELSVLPYGIRPIRRGRHDRE